MMNLNLVLLFLNIFSFANCTVYFIVQYILFPQLYSLFHYGNCTFFLLWLFVQYIAKCTIYSLMIFIKYIVFNFFNCIFNICFAICTMYSFLTNCLLYYVFVVTTPCSIFADCIFVTSYWNICALLK